MKRLGITVAKQILGLLKSNCPHTPENLPEEIESQGVSAENKMLPRD